MIGKLKSYVINLISNSTIGKTIPYKTRVTRLYFSEPETF
jgi:hypothetical protein